MMQETSGLIAAYLLDGKGGARSLGWDEVKRWQPEDGVIWVHLNRKAEESHSWLHNESGLEELITEALLAEETRPRAAQMQNGLLVNLRGVNLNPGAEPDDMISCRCWFDANRIITLRYPKLQAIQALREAFEAGCGPVGQGDFLVRLLENLTNNMAPVIDAIEEEVDRLDEAAFADPQPELIEHLSDEQNKAITLRRYIAPQRDVVHQLIKIPQPWLDNEHRRIIYEIQDQITKFIEDLDAARARADVDRQTINYQLDRKRNYSIYILSLVTMIFMPLTFFTGLLGINVAGIPYEENPYAFWGVCGLLVLLVVIQLWIFFRLKLFR